MGHFIRKLADVAVPGGMPVTAIAAFGLLTTPWPGYLLCLLGLCYGWYRYGLDGLGELRIGNTLTAGAILLGAAIHGPDGFPLAATVVAGAVLAGLFAFEPLLLVALSTSRLESAHLEVWRANRGRWWQPRVVYGALSVLLGAFLVTTAVNVGQGVTAAASVVVALSFAAGALRQWRTRRRHAHAGDAGVLAAVTAHQPRFAVHYSAPVGSEYQLRMWLPYFDRMGAPYLIILRDRGFLASFVNDTKAPIVVAPSISDMENMLVPSIKSVFYTNNSMQNAQCVRFAGLTHVQLMHGDSDKPASYNPVSGMFDQIFVAGQCGIDRYHSRGIDIPLSRFRVVGHPQVAPVTVGPRDPGDGIVALYAPTWTGQSSDTNFCSLPIGKEICAELIARGATIIVRPHPYTRLNPAAARHLDALERLLGADAESSGRRHLYGKTTSEHMSLVDCINAADVMVSDTSGAASTWLYSERPFALTDMTNVGDNMSQELPLSRAAYVVHHDASNISSVCDDLLHDDPLAADRRKMKVYYLGDFPTADYEETFLKAARDTF